MLTVPRGKLSFVFSVLLMLTLAYFGVSIAVTSFGAEESVEQELPVTPSEPVDTRTPEEKSKWDIDGVIWGLHVDWKALYPEKEEEKSEEKGLAARIAAAIGEFEAQTAEYRAAVDEAKAAVETAASDGVPHYQEIVELANAYDAWLAWELVDPLSYNPVIEAEKGYFLTCTPRADQSGFIQQGSARNALFAQFETPYLYVQLPGKTCFEDTQSGAVDFYNQNADRLLEGLAHEGVATLDLREKMHEDGMEHHACFYKTDHHWLPQTGLWAARTIAEELNENYGFAADLALLEEEKFEQELYEDWFLGSQGKKVTLERAEVEDFALWHPTYDTALHIEIPSLGLDKKGEMRVCYRYGALLNNDYYVDNAYGAYLYGDQALVRITNENNAGGKDILILGDSYDNCLVPFLSTAAHRIDTLDLRFFDGSLEAFLEENEYDVVLELHTK